MLSDEDRILRLWTPVILRTVLIVAALTLLAGLVSAILLSPGYFVDRFRDVQAGGALHARQAFSLLFANALHGDPHSVMTVGLMVLTLVPLGRVAFCFLLFVRQKDPMYVAFTAYVLLGLIIGVALGRVG